MLHDFFFLVHPVTAFKRGPHGRLVFAKCVLPSVNKVYYHFFFFFKEKKNSVQTIFSDIRGCFEISMYEIF